MHNKKSVRFLVVDFSQSAVAVVCLESLSPGKDVSAPCLKVLAYEVKKINSSHDKEAVSFIQDFCKKNSIARKETRVIVSDPVIIKTLSLPGISEKEISGAIRWQLQEEAAFDLEKACLDWKVLDQGDDSETKNKNGVICAAAERGGIDRYVAILDQCGLKAVNVTSASFNYANILKYLDSSQGLCAVLDIDYKGSTINFYKNKSLYFVRPLPISEERIIQALTRILVSGHGKIELSLEEAERIKNTIGIPESESQVIKENIQGIHILSLMRPIVEALVRELKFSFDYFTSMFEAQRPVVLYLAGSGAHLKNLDKYLSKELKMDVRLLPCPPGVEISNNINHLDRPKVMNAAGAALGGPESIDFLSQTMKPAQANTTRSSAFSMISKVMVVIFVLFLFKSAFEIELSYKEVKKARSILWILDGVRIWHEKAYSMDGMIRKIEKNKLPTDIVLKMIGLSIPNEIILDELSLDQTIYQLVLKGKIFAQTDLVEGILTNFMQQLESSPVFVEVRLVSSQNKESSQEFEVICEFYHE